MLDPVILDGKYVRLEPLSRHHREGLCTAIRDGELWKLHVTSVPHPDEIDAFLAAADQVAVDASGLVFATIHKGSAEIIGSTRFMHASPANRRVEIGYTFLAQSHQRTPINTEAKSLKPNGDAGWAYQRLNDLQHHRERMERSKKGP